jgi:hypothetical protein
MKEDLMTPFSVGAVCGGQEYPSTPIAYFGQVLPGLTRFCASEIAAKIEAIGEREAAINLIFHVSGDFLKADEFTVRTGSFLKSKRLQIVQARIPDDVQNGDDVRRVIVHALLDCGPEVIQSFHRRKIDLSIERSLACLQEAAVFLASQLAENHNS